ncbi:EAL domain-containing protein [Salinisphaera orenii]|nr:EAL domain-containing protein [Salinisphaera halophila]
MVGLGGSAGGLEAFQAFFTAMGEDSGMAFVVVSHLAPDHHSQLSELLAKVTLMPVRVVDAPVAVQAGHVYVIAPNRHLDIHDGRLQPMPMAARHGIPTTIYRFFRALAADQGPKAVGIVLSGSGSDGSEGIRAIKAHGGLTIVQSPETARFDSMPRSAIDTGMADHVLPVEQMPTELRRYVRHAYIDGGGPLSADSDVADAPSETLDAILDTVRRRHGHDFRHYKAGTLSRRVERRMGVCQVSTSDAYLKMLSEDPQELDRLFADLLIGVTGFFRDPAGFEALEAQVLPALVGQRDSPDPIRVWVPGCATGEEAYSIAIVLYEAIEAAGSRQRLQLFATDIDARALEQARSGVFPETIAEDVSPERLERWFTRIDHGFRIDKSIREVTVFAVQNLISDPPFSRIDLICCRNLLIYLDQEIQKRVIRLFHYALRPQGALFLGNSEYIGKHYDLFSVISRKWRLYRRMEGDTRGLGGFDLTTPAPAERSAPVVHAPAQPETRPQRRIVEATQRLLLSDYAPASVVVTARFETLYMHGSVGEFLDFPMGEPTTHLLTLARRGLRNKLRAAVKTVLDGGPARVEDQARMLRDQQYREVRIVARRFTPAGLDEPYVLISMCDADKAPSTEAPDRVSNDGGDAELVAQLEHELRSTQEELQASTEEMEGANEELKAANEESLSMNEELQSANEELESSKEELQSLNEELNTVNAELQQKVEEVELANNDLVNLLSSTDIATIFLDKQGRIKRFTPAATALFNLIDNDIGRPVDDISNRLSAPLDLAADVRRVLDTLTTVESEEQTGEGRWFIRRMLPYRTVDDRIDGVVLTLSEITAIKATEQALRATEARFRGLYDDNPLMYLSLDRHDRIISINRFGARQLGYGDEAVVGRPFADLHTDTRALASELQRCRDNAGEPQRWETRLECADGSMLWVRANARQARDADDNPIIVIACEDISEQKRLSEEVYYHATHDALTGLINRREFERLLGRAVDNARERGEVHALCYIDLDNFKVVNDTYGHHAGDELLRQLTSRMLETIRQQDLLGRLGGDEFALLLDHCSIEDAERIANGLIEAIDAQEFLWHGYRLRVGACIGAVAIDATTGQTASVLQSADAACFAAKDVGPGTLQRYAEDDAVVRRRRIDMNWANRLRSALRDDRIEMYAQPICAVADDSVRGYETLVRMRGAEDELIEPDRFMQAALRYGLIRELDLAVLRKTLECLAANVALLDGVAWVSINLSGTSLAHPGCAETTIESIRASGVDPTKLCFEITETSVISNLSQAQHFIDALHGFGCSFALDDFGVGLSSFHYLRVLPVDYIKIDGSFIRDMRDDRSVRAMVEAINGIAHLMGKQTIAECVESAAIMDVVRALKIDYAQGFHYARPLPLLDALQPGAPAPGSDADSFGKGSDTGALDT